MAEYQDLFPRIRLRASVYRVKKSGTAEVFLSSLIQKRREVFLCSNFYHRQMAGKGRHPSAMKCS